ADAHHGGRGLDLLHVVRDDVDVRADAARAVGNEVRDRGDVLHAPQVRPQDLQGAVHRAADHRGVHADGIFRAVLAPGDPAVEATTNCLPRIFADKTAG